MYAGFGALMITTLISYISHSQVCVVLLFVNWKMGEPVMLAKRCCRSVLVREDDK